jgi:Uma2 family endonuclease
MSVQEPVSSALRLSLAEFMRLFEQEGPFELVDGERKPVLPGIAEHSEIIKLIYGFLLAYERSSGHAVTYAETAYVLMLSPDWVTGARIPDVMAYDGARLAEYKVQDSDWRRKPFVLIPDLCVEVVSPNDSYTDVDEKVARYLADGVRLVWVVNPRAASVQVYTASTIQSARLTAEHTLDGGDVLPGFTLPVSQIFPE